MTEGRLPVRTIVAAMVFVGMLGLAWLDRVIVSTRVMRAVNEQSLAAGVNMTQVEELRITNRHGVLRAVRQGGQWQVVEPFGAPADGEKIETILYNITGARRNNEIEAKNLATYGLGEPAATVELVHGPSRDVFRLALGNDSTYTGQVFAQYPGGRTLFTVGSHVKNTVMLPPSDIRRSRLLDVDVGNLAAYQSIVLGGDADRVELRAERGKWTIISPMEAVAENTVVEEWLKSVGLLKASGFLAESGDTQTSAAEALAALTSPTLTISLGRSPNQKDELHLAQIPGGSDRIWVARRPGDPEILLVRPEFINTLRQDAGYFRSRQIFSLEPADVSQISFSVGQARTDLIRNKDGIWVFADRPECLVDQDAVAVRLELLLKARVKQYVDLNPTDLSNFGFPRMRFSVTSKDGQITEMVETGDTERGGALTTVYARRRGDPAVFTMDVTKDLVILADTVSVKNFARFNYDRLSKISIELGSDVHELTLVQRSAWRLRRSGETADGAADKPRMDRFLAMMDNLQSLRDYGCTGDRVISPPSENKFTVKALAEDGTVLMELNLGRANGERVFMNVNGRTVEANNAEVERLIAQALSVVQ